MGHSINDNLNAAILQSNVKTAAARRCHEDKSSKIKGYLAHFSSQARKMKKIHSEKISYIFSKVSLIFLEMELSRLRLKEFLIFFQKYVLYFGKLIQTYVSGNGTP